MFMMMKNCQNYCQKEILEIINCLKNGQNNRQKNGQKKSRRLTKRSVIIRMGFSMKNVQFWV